MTDPSAAQGPARGAGSAAQGPAPLPGRRDPSLARAEARDGSEPVADAAQGPAPLPGRRDPSLARAEARDDSTRWSSSPASDEGAPPGVSRPNNPAHQTPTDADLASVRQQLGRPPRGILAITSRCPSGHPNVVKTEPRLPDGTPFPTLYYVTCPRLAGAIGTLEASGLMADMSQRLQHDDELAEHYRAAHTAYLAEREAIAHVPEIEGISAGGMPTRVKCLHVLVGHSLSKGPGVNPLGDEAVDLLGAWWGESSCAPRHG